MYQQTILSSPKGHHRVTFILEPQTTPLTRVPCALDQGEEPPTHCQKLSNDPQRKSFAEAMIFYHFLDRYGYINFEFKPNHVNEGSEEQETAHMVLFVGAGPK